MGRELRGIYHLLEDRIYAYVRAQLFDDGRLIEHHTAAYQGQAINDLAKLWLTMPAELRETTGVSQVKARIYPQRPAA